MARAGVKYQMPCTGNLTVGVYNGYSGNNFMTTFKTKTWSPIMLSTEVIPSTFFKTRRWVSFCLSILGYACEVLNKPIDGDEWVFPTHRSGNQERDRVLDPRLEKEQTDLIKEAIYFLYGKRAIRFFPPRPGTEITNEEFVIPDFSHGSKNEWYGRHYVIVLQEFGWTLSEGERS